MQKILNFIPEIKQKQQQFSTLIYPFFTRKNMQTIRKKGNPYISDILVTIYRDL